MRVLVTGAKGMLGRSFCKSSINKYELVTPDHKELDISNPIHVYKYIEKVRPDVVLHCAAMTAVDQCEIQADQAFKVNAIGCANVAIACNAFNSRLISISTDYVFDGDRERAYTEYDVATGGHTVYGRSKWAGEQLIRTHCPNHLIARVAWLYGEGGPSFVHTMLKLAESLSEIKVVNDQRGNPTSVLAVSRYLQKLMDYPEINGTIHLTCEGEVTWYQFAQKIFKIKGISKQITPCGSEEYIRPAKRPKNSCLEKYNLRLLGLEAMPYWEYELENFIKGNKI